MLKTNPTNFKNKIKQCNDFFKLCEEKPSEDWKRNNIFLYEMFLNADKQTAASQGCFFTNYHWNISSFIGQDLWWSENFQGNHLQPFKFCFPIQIFSWELHEVFRVIDFESISLGCFQNNISVSRSW